MSTRAQLNIQLCALTKHHCRIAAPRGFGLVLGETLLFRTLALEALLGALIELALEGSLLLLVR